MKRWKIQCAACEKTGKKINKEHYWPKWLIHRTGTGKTTIKWGDKQIRPFAATLPMCSDCNTEFGRDLEGPVSRLFEEIETGKGLTDFEAELFVRWLWKMEGLAWNFHHPEHKYSEKYTLRERVLYPIDGLRPKLKLAISLLDRIDDDFEDKPMGLDALNQVNAIFVIGVLSYIAVMVLHEDFEKYVPPEFTVYGLAEKRLGGIDAKVFFPKTGFETCTDAVVACRKIGPFLAYLHDKMRDG
jgi:hypothetical protein